MNIQGSVGDGGANAVSDVFCVQLLLNVWRNTTKQSEIAEDGQVGPETIGAIREFQQRKTGWVDGRVDPDGRAHRALQEHARPYINEALAFSAMGIASTFMPTLYEEVEENLPVTNANLLRVYSFRQTDRG
jgi:peptidoglycan hydrolase-like protein with peptidoglycan-binding domain